MNTVLDDEDDNDKCTSQGVSEYTARASRRVGHTNRPGAFPPPSQNCAEDHHPSRLQQQDLIS